MASSSPGATDQGTLTLLVTKPLHGTSSGPFGVVALNRLRAWQVVVGQSDNRLRYIVVSFQNMQTQVQHRSEFPTTQTRHGHVILSVMLRFSY
jgi:hypothetical protein